LVWVKAISMSSPLRCTDGIERIAGHVVVEQVLQSVAALDAPAVVEMVRPVLR
jgi:hypothetical protein